MACVDNDIGSSVGAAVFSGSTSGAGNEFNRCGSSSSVEDLVVRWTAPASGAVTFDTEVSATSDTYLIAASGGCASPTYLECDDDDGTGYWSTMTRTVAEGDVVFLALEAYSGTGSVTLNITPEFELDCFDAADDDGDGFTDCDDTDCASACFELDCRDGLDGEGDGFTDCDDTECASDVTCIPESACTDGLDSDLDGLTDCADTDCAGDFACGATCFDGNLGGAIGYAVATGTTIGGTDDRTPTCGDYSGLNDMAYVWTAPASDTYTFTTQDSGFDTILTVEEPACVSSELGCNDDNGLGLNSSVSVTLAAGDQVIVNVDGYDEEGAYVLSVYGTTEDCDSGVDDDGDGAADCDDSDCGCATWYRDSDGDRFGDSSVSIAALDAPAGYVHDSGDCNDAARTIHPYAWEDTANGVDDDCDGLTDGADTAATRVSLSDDSYATQTFGGGFTFPFCGTSYSSLYLGSNGRLTFDASNSSASESASSFVTTSSTPRRAIAGMWDDLNPASASSTGVYVVQDAGAYSIYFRSVVEYGSTTSTNTFAMTLLADGRFMVDTGTLGSTDGLIGWTCGTASSSSVAESDMSALRSALPAGAYGIRTGSPHAIYEVFTSSDNDLDNQTFLFCPTSGTDADADGWTVQCGDRDDADASVYPR